MLYIVCALKPEAQAFIDKYKLKKESLAKFKVFSSQSVKLIVSGLGVSNSREATQTLINHFDIVDEDIYLNIGICGANREYEIAQLINISSIVYEKQTYLLKRSSGKTITCIDTEATSNEHQIVDMESFGFYDAVIHSPAIKNIFILKVVSDHFEPHLVTKEKTKTLIFNAINDINAHIFNKDET